MAQGDYTGAAISAGSIIVPFGADKIAKAVSRVPTQTITHSVQAIAEAGLKSTDNIAELAEATGKVANKAEDLKAVVQCVDGAVNCFTADQAIVVDTEVIPLDSTRPMQQRGESRWSLFLIVAGTVFGMLRQRQSDSSRPTRKRHRALRRWCQ